MGDDGLPVSCGVPTDSGSKDKADGYPQLNSDYIRHDEHDQWQVDVRRLFSDAIGGRQQVTGAELRSEVCRLSNIRSWKFYNSLLEQAVNGEVIMKSYDHAAHVIYALRPCIRTASPSEAHRPLHISVPLYGGLQYEGRASTGRFSKLRIEN